jgi:hypothetical protein
MKKIFFFVALLAFVQVNAQQITDIEFFFDNDPGKGNSTAVTVATPAAVINDLSFTASTASLVNGMHTLYTRSKDNMGNWSNANKHLFVKQPITIVGNITKLEYFFDNDPGFGNATNIAGFSPGTTINDFVFTADATALSNGPHFLYVRSKDDWSITNKILFFKEPLTSLTNITQIEYFIDKDPGIGNGIKVSFTPTNTVSDLVFSANFSGYTVGTHYFFARSKDANGKWSLTNVMQYNQSIVLPLSWLSFTVKKVNTTSLLDWRTANELQVAHFEIERSANGIYFEKIGITIAKNGTQNDYKFTDIKPIVGKNYYRIKQIDVEGKFSYTSIDMVDFGKIDKLIAITNNPSNNPVIKITTNNIATLLLFDANGKIVHKQSLENIYNISIGNLIHTGGQYIATLLDKNGLVVAVEKIAVIK